MCLVVDESRGGEGGYNDARSRRESPRGEERYVAEGVLGLRVGDECELLLEAGGYRSLVHSGYSLEDFPGLRYPVLGQQPPEDVVASALLLQG